MTISKKESQKIPQKIPMFLNGLSLGQGNFRAAMIFKDKDEREVLPIWLDPLEANLLLAESQNGARRGILHGASFKIFEALKIQVKSIYFNEVTGSGQFAEMQIAESTGKEINVRVRASEALTLGVNAGCAFFTDRNVVERSRALTLEYVLHLSKGPTAQVSRDSMH